jgi:hypothetical protein
VFGVEVDILRRGDEPPMVLPRTLAKG